MEWRRVTFTEHMAEAAVLVGECQVVLDFGSERLSYEIKVYESLKGGTDRYFALGTNRDDPAGYRPVGGATTPEAALQECLAAAGVFHRRRARQVGE